MISVLRVLLLSLSLAMLLPNRAEATCGTPSQSNYSVDYSKLKLLSRSTQDDYKGQPMVYTFGPSFETSHIDNVCFTMFPLPDDCNSFIYYRARVSRDNSSEITAYLVTLIAPGHNRYVTPLSTSDNYFLGVSICNTYVILSTTQSEDGLPYVYGAAPLADRYCYDAACQLDVERIIESQGLPVGNFTVLPNKLPTQCVTQQLCVSQGNGLYESQGGSCQPFDGCQQC